MPLPTPSYLTSEYYQWNGNQVDAVLANTYGSGKEFTVWKHLDVYGKQQLHDLIMAYADKNSAVEATALPIPASPGWQVVNMGGTAVGGNATGLTGTTLLTAERTEVTTVADVSRSLSGTHFTVNSPSTNYYVWYYLTGVAEHTEFYAVADSNGSLSGTHFTVNSPSTNYYVWLNVAARSEITTVDFTSHTIVPADYWTLNAPSGAFYVWYDVDISGAIDPAPGGTGIKVDILSTDTPAQIATKTNTAVDGNVNLGSSVLSNVVTVTNATAGAVTDAADFNAGVVTLVTQQGISASVDPTPGGTGIQVNISGDDNMDTVAFAVAGAVNALGDFSSAATGGGPVGDFTITNAATGSVIDATAGTSGFSVSVLTQGINDSSDPAPGGTGLQVTLVINDTADNVASKTQVVVNGQADFTASVTANKVAIDNVNIGDTTDATAGTSGFAINIQQGTTQAADSSFAVIEVDGTPYNISVDGDNASTFTDLLAEMNTALGANAVASIINGNIDITSASTGNTSTVDVVDGTLFTVLNGFVEFDGQYFGATGLKEALELNLYAGRPIIELFIVKTVPNITSTRSNDKNRVYFNHSTTTWKYIFNDADVV